MRRECFVDLVRGFAWFCVGPSGFLVIVLHWRRVVVLSLFWFPWLGPPWVPQGLGPRDSVTGWPVAQAQAGTQSNQFIVAVVSWFSPVRSAPMAQTVAVKLTLPEWKGVLVS